MVQNTAAKVVTYACKRPADHTARILEQSFEGMLLRIDGKETWSRLIGAHNAYNLLAIYTTAVCLGTDPDEVLVALSNLQSAPGRLENLRGPRDLAVVIDYAHTPDALENVLVTLRDVAPERQLICLFGCGGDRDKTKRPEMAQVASASSSACSAAAATATRPSAPRWRRSRPGSPTASSSPPTTAGPRIRRPS